MIYIIYQYPHKFYIHYSNYHKPLQVCSSRRCRCRRIRPTLWSTPTLPTRTGPSSRTAPSTPPNGIRSRCANFYRTAPRSFRRPLRLPTAAMDRRPPIIGSACRRTKGRHGHYPRRRMMMTLHAHNNNRNDTFLKIDYTI